MISLAAGRLLFPHPEERIREYCELEVYYGYDDFHSIDNKITERDIEASKRIFSMIDQHGHSESLTILNSLKIPAVLSKIPDAELADVPNSDWYKMSENIIALFNSFHEIYYVGLAKTVKILHLKRPHLFPILDSYVVEFLTGVNPQNVSKHNYTNLGISALGITRKDIIQNLSKHKLLQYRLSDLPIPLTIVRMYDILCWTTWKWDKLGKVQTNKWIPTNSGYVGEKGYASKTLLDKKYLSKINLSPKKISKKYPRATKHEKCTEINTINHFNSIKSRGEGFIVVTDTTGNKIHRASCRWLKKNYFEEKVTTNRKRNGRYFWCRDYKDGLRFRVKDCKSCI